MAENVKTVIDTEAKEVNDSGKKSFPEAHPVMYRRIKKTLKILGTGAAIFASVCAAEAYKDKRRVYYTLELKHDDDSSVHLADYTDAPVDDGSTVVVNE